MRYILSGRRCSYEFDGLAYLLQFLGGRSCVQVAGNGGGIRLEWGTSGTEMFEVLASSDDVAYAPVSGASVRRIIKCI